MKDFFYRLEFRLFRRPISWVAQEEEDLKGAVDYHPGSCVIREVVDLIQLFPKDSDVFPKTFDGFYDSYFDRCSGIVACATGYFGYALHHGVHEYIEGIRYDRFWLVKTPDKYQCDRFSEALASNSLSGVYINAPAVLVGDASRYPILQELRDRGVYVFEPKYYEGKWYLLKTYNTT